MPSLDEIDRQMVRIDYDPLDDSLWVGLTSEPRPTYNVSVDEDMMYQVDPDTNEVIGLEIEHFLYRLLHRPPDYAESRNG
jgi:hypothetical protein